MHGHGSLAVIALISKQTMVIKTSPIKAIFLVHVCLQPNGMIAVNKSYGYLVGLVLILLPKVRKVNMYCLDRTLFTFYSALRRYPK